MEVTGIIAKLLVCISAMLFTTQRLAVLGISIFSILVGHMCATAAPPLRHLCPEDVSHPSPLSIDLNEIHSACSLLGRIVSAIVSMFLPRGVRLRFGAIDFLAARRLELTLERVPLGPSFAILK